MTFAFFDGEDLGDPLSTVFRGFESKFRKVHHVVLRVGSSRFMVECAEVVPLVFPNVRHVKLDTVRMHVFFRTHLDDPCPADRWGSLESLTSMIGKLAARYVQQISYGDWNGGN